MPNDKEEEERMKALAAQMRRREYEGLSEEEIRQREEQKELKKRANIAALDETLSICEAGRYEKGGEIRLKASLSNLSEVSVFMPDDIKKLGGEAFECETEFSCENIDSMSLAARRAAVSDKVLVLNLASCTRPGGATRDGANGQEEDLCRKSSLLLSLESEDAKPFYDYGNSLKSHLGSDAVMISPKVEVIRDGKGELLDEPFEIAVLSCSAPMIRFGLEGKTDEEYRALLRGRIEGMLRCAKSLGYEDLVLGAFGCGIFGNDAAIVSQIFSDVLTGPCKNFFKRADFAVLCTDGKDYNFKEFAKRFGGCDG